MIMNLFGIFVVMTIGYVVGYKQSIININAGRIKQDANGKYPTTLF